MRLAEVGLRPILDNGEERDDAKEVLKLAVASIARERGFADQSYLRGRNAFAVSATLFTAAQAAFVSSTGRIVGKEPLLSSAEKHDILIPAGIGVLFLVSALAVLIFWLDRPRKMTLVGSQSLWDAWINRSGTYNETPVLEALVVQALKEEKEWATTNDDRRKALRVVGLLCGLVGIAALVQLYILYLGLS